MITQSRWSAAEALAFGHGGDSTTYDDIGARVRSKTPRVGHFPLQTLPDLRRERVARQRARLPEHIEEIFDLADRLPHRAIELPKISGRMSYEVRGTVVHLTMRDEKAPNRRPEVWSFALSAPPSILREHAEDDDIGLTLNQTHRIAIPGQLWLPLPLLIRVGRVARMQEWRDRLVGEVPRGQLGLFVSHRWLTAEEPDPEGRQAAMIAWQIFAAVCEAIRVAQYRGLHGPRRRNTSIGAVVGPSGSDLAEAILVNVLRSEFQADDIAGLHAETADLEPVTANHGLAAARTDTGLARLRDLLGSRPLTSSVLDRILLWYDYGCMPQRPHATAQDEQEFQAALQNLAVFQAGGRTLILLDDADAHLTRAWCTFEAIVAERLAGYTDVLVGSDRPAGRYVDAEHDLIRALRDRPHLVWRGLLDTEVLGVQDRDQCLTRLGLTATHRPDLPIVYEHLLRLGSPSGTHVDDSEVLSGTFPLPQAGDAVVVPLSGGHAPGGPPPASGSLDWTGALRTGGRGPFAAEPSSQRLGSGDAHVAIVAACEGEAILIADWVRHHLPELAAVAGGSIGSLTWLASDIAPVGRRPEGVLRTTLVDAKQWILVAASARLQNCTATGVIMRAVAAARRPLTFIGLDVQTANVVPLRAEPGDDRFRRVSAAVVPTVEIPGGLFRPGLLELMTTMSGGPR